MLVMITIKNITWHGDTKPCNQLSEALKLILKQRAVGFMENPLNRTGIDTIWECSGSHVQNVMAMIHPEGNTDVSTCPSFNSHLNLGQGSGVTHLTLIVFCHVGKPQTQPC